MTTLVVFTVITLLLLATCVYVVPRLYRRLKLAQVNRREWEFERQSKMRAENDKQRRRQQSIDDLQIIRKIHRLPLSKESND